MKEHNERKHHKRKRKSNRVDIPNGECGMDSISSRNNASSNANSRNNYTKAADIVQSWADNLNRYHQSIEEKYTDEYIEQSSQKTAENVGNAIIKAGEAFARFGESIKPFK